MKTGYRDLRKCGNFWRQFLVEKTENEMDKHCQETLCFGFYMYSDKY